MDLRLLKTGIKYVAESKPAQVGISVRKITFPLKSTKPVTDVFAKKADDVLSTTIKPFEFNPRTGTALPLTEVQTKKVVGAVTRNPEEQRLLTRMIENESIVVTSEVEQQVMKRQFMNFKKSHPEVNPEQMYIYSPMPKGQVKSYTDSGKAFAQASGIDKSHIKTTFDDIPENATVFMSDDCSISGASMVFDLLEHLPANFKGRVVIAPTVKGTGTTLRGDVLADDVLNMFAGVNKKGVDRKGVAEELKFLISDNKTDNIKALDKLASSENYRGVTLEIAEGSLPARNFRNTETFRNLSKNEQRKVDSLFTASGINTGYHDSGVMVLLPTKTPNNNVGIMELIGEEMGLKVKPNGILSFKQNTALKNEGKRCAIAALPDSNNRGNSTELIFETFKGGKRAGRVPYSAKGGEPVDFVVKLADGTEHTVKYSAKVEEKAKMATESLYGFEVPESLAEISRHKGLYRPKTIKGEKGYRVDVLAIPNDAQIVSVGGVPISQLWKI